MKFRETDDKFALAYKQNPEFDILCAHFAMHQNFQFDRSTLRALKSKLKVITKMSANTLKNKFT